MSALHPSPAQQEGTTLSGLHAPHSHAAGARGDCSGDAMREKGLVPAVKHRSFFILSNAVLLILP